MAVASALFGLSTVQSEAASSATMVFTVDAGLVTHISITEPFGFQANASDTFREVGIFIPGLYEGNPDFMMAPSAEPPSGMFLVAGSAASYTGVSAFSWGMMPDAVDGDFLLYFAFRSTRLSLTNGDFVEISGGFDVDPEADLSAPTAGSYSATLYYVNEAPVDPISNTLLVNIVVNSVPEPGSSLLGLLGASTLFLRRRRG